MSDRSSIALIDEYVEEASAPMFLSSLFKTPAKNFHQSDKIEIDILRDDEDVAIVVTDLSTGPRNNESTLFSNKAFTPPILWERGGISAFNKTNRAFGQDPFQSVDALSQALDESRRLYRQLENKMRRTVEMMCSQVLQGAVVTLTDSAGTALYTLDFQARSALHAAVSTEWATAGTSGNPIADLDARARLVRRYGKKNPTDLIFGQGAWQRFMANTQVRSELDNRRIELGSIVHQNLPDGVTYNGKFAIGHHAFDLWTYDGFYRDPATGNLTDYIATDTVVMLSKSGRLDLTFGGIPRIVAPDPRVASFMPGRISSVSKGLDLNPWASVSQHGTHVDVEVGTRPLPIPVGIDTFASMHVGS